MAPAEVMERLNHFKKAARPSGQITVTELARGKDWRRELPKVGMMEVTDRGETAGWLVSQEDLEAFVYALVDLEKEVEDLSLAAMFEARATEGQHNWESGTQLAEDAKSYLDADGDKIMAIIDGYR